MGFSIELVDGIVQANNNTFKLVRGKDIDFTQATNVNYTGLASGDLILFRDINADVSTNTNADIKSTSLNNFAVFMVSHIGSGNGGFVPSAGSANQFLAHNGVFAQVDYGNLSGTPNIPSITNATDNRVLTSTGGTGINAESNLTFNGNTLDLEANIAQVIIHRTGDDSNAPFMTFLKDRGSAGVDDDEVARLQFSSFDDDSTPNNTIYAMIVASISDATEAEESGNLALSVSNHGGGGQVGLLLKGDTNIANTVDVDIAKGTGSTTTVAGDLTVTGDIVSSKITTSAEQSVLAGNLSIGAHDDEDRIFLARYSSAYPHAHIFCGLNANNVTTGFKIVTKNGSTYSDALVINGSNKSATFSGNLSTSAQLTVANNINANGNIVGDGGTDITNISDISAANGSFTGVVSSVRQTANNIETNIRSSRVGTAAGKIGGLCEQINEGTVYGGGNLTAGRVYFLTEDNTSSGTPSWREATAGAVSGSSGLLAIALGTDPTDGMLLRGMIVISSTQLGNKTPGDTLFLSAATGGRITDTPPSSSGEVQRILGHYFLTTPTDGHSMIHFNPSQEFITIA